MNTVPIYRAYLPGQQPSADDAFAERVKIAREFQKEWITPHDADEEPASGQPDAEAGTGGVTTGTPWPATRAPQGVASEEGGPLNTKPFSSQLNSPIVSPPQTIAAVVASTSRDAPAASPFEMPDIPACLDRRSKAA